MSSSVGASGVDSAPSMAAKPLVVCSFISVPTQYHKAFAYLDGTQLFFLGGVRRLNRLSFRTRCVCFVTDYTINIASRRGQVTRCAKVEDVAELICDDKRHTLGVRMRSRPFAINPADGPRWNCFYEMPVDLVLYADSAAQYASLVHVLRFVYRTCTHETLSCRPLHHREAWQATLIVTPDGSRVKKRPMCYHPAVSSVTDDAGAAADLPATPRHAPDDTRPADPPPLLSAIETSPAAASPSTHSPYPAATPVPSATSRLPRRSARAASVPSSASDRRTAPPVVAASGAPAVSGSATRRRVNPLVDASYEPATPVSTANGATVAFSVTAPARPSPSRRSEVAGERLHASPNGPRTSSTTPPAAGAAGSVPPSIPQLQHSRYAREGELDDVKRYRESFTADPHASRYTSTQWSSRSSPQLILSPCKAPGVGAASTAPRLPARPKSGSAGVKVDEMAR